MIEKTKRRTLGSALATGAMILAVAPAMAQDAAADIDAMIDAAASAAGTLRLARSQANQGDLTRAAATLERALLGGTPKRDAGVRH